MFGLAIWDERRKRLVIARDAAGIKLVYYRVDDSTVSFGSELRAVLAALPRRPEIDVTAVNLFLRYRYTPSPLTLYDGVRKLAPGSMAVFEDGGWRVERGYRFRPTQFSPPLTDEDASEQLLDVYKRALKRHLIADVPVGLLLSGGVDSGLLLGLMRLYGDTWPTYTVGYGSAAYKDDELADAAETAKLFSCSNASVTLSRDTFESTLSSIVSMLEEPIAASSIVPMYFVCQRARQDVKVALVGQGPDELLVVTTVTWAQAASIGDGFRNGTRSGVARHSAPPAQETLKRGIYCWTSPIFAPVSERVLDSARRGSRPSVQARNPAPGRRRSDSRVVDRSRARDGRLRRARRLPGAGDSLLTAGRAPHVRRQALDGAWSRTARAIRG
jgi:asparagine synthase (glutamine-hydrolysing)